MVDDKNNCCGQDSDCCENMPEHRMCMMTRPLGKFDLEKVIKLADNPQYICKCCGRMANDKENLCSPVTLNRVDR